ncbi:MAG TPA: hypothetical protein VGX94_13260 [Terriglobia bacterium]|nr:hypothetical protein [Terriglobia bacterium]
MNVKNSACLDIARLLLARGAALFKLADHAERRIALLRIGGLLRARALPNGTNGPNEFNEPVQFRDAGKLLHAQTTEAGPL